jgi:hypothetical protein
VPSASASCLISLTDLWRSQIPSTRMPRSQIAPVWGATTAPSMARQYQDCRATGPGSRGARHLQCAWLVSNHLEIHVEVRGRPPGAPRALASGPESGVPERRRFSMSQPCGSARRVAVDRATADQWQPVTHAPVLVHIALTPRGCYSSRSAVNSTNNELVKAAHSLQDHRRPHFDIGAGTTIVVDSVGPKRSGGSVALQHEPRCAPAAYLHQSIAVMTSVARGLVCVRQSTTCVSLSCASSPGMSVRARLTSTQ